MKCVINKQLLFFIICFTVFKINAQSVGGTTSGLASDCAARNAGFLSLNGSHGSILNWESSTDGGSTWTNIGGTSISHSFNGLLVSTCYRAIVQDGVNPLDTSSVWCITIFSPSVAGSISGGGSFCASPGSGSGTLTLSGNTGNVLYWQHSIDGGISWDTIANNTSALNYSNITQSTLYTSVVRHGPAVPSIDSISCPSDTSTTAVFVVDSVTVPGTLLSSDTACYGANSKTLDLTGKVGSVLNWLSSSDGGNTWSSITNSSSSQTYTNLIQTTWYAAVVRSGVCNTDTSTYAKIIIVSPGSVSAGNDVTIIKGQSTVLNGVGIGTPFWTPSTGLDSTNIFKPTASPVNSTTYILSVTGPHFCVSSDTIVVTISETEFSGVISNLFTPNGDGINDSWYIQNIQNYPENEVFVYNIYGNLVYSKKGYTNDWQGTFNGIALPDGTYYYVIRFDSSSMVSKGALDILKNK